MLLKSVNILAGARSPLATSAPAAPALGTAVSAPALAAPMMAIPAAMVAIIVLDVVNYGGQYGGAYNQTKRGRHVFIMRA
jgi:hypothetical protein